MRSPQLVRSFGSRIEMVLAHGIAELSGIRRLSFCKSCNRINALYPLADFGREMSTGHITQLNVPTSAQY